MKKKSKKKVLLGAVLVLAMGLTACGGSENSGNAEVTEENSGAAESAQTEETDKVVRIGAVTQGNILNATGGIAQEKGFLEEELEKAGYKLEVKGFAQAGPAINEAFGAGELDMAIYGDLPATVCKSNGIDTTIFAVNDSKMQMCILAANGSDIKSAKDFKGHKVIVGRGTIYHQCFKSLIADAGIAEEDVEQINTVSDANSVIASGEADALVTASSIGYYLEAQGIGTVVETTADHPEWTSQFFAVGKTDYLKENPEAAKAVIRALKRAYEFSKDNLDEVAEISASLTDGYTADVFEKVYDFDPSFEHFNPEITEESKTKLKALEQFLEDEELISNPVDIDQFVDTSYYEAVINEE